jgi:hypothetical protein
VTRVEQLLERLGSDLTEHDFALLAIECADQAGLSLEDLARHQDQIQAESCEGCVDRLPVRMDRGRAMHRSDDDGGFVCTAVRP